jgi:ribosomal protein S18 acetylase RimI-like enzyme
MRIREPVPEDAEALGRVHVRAWQVAYRGMMPDEYLDGLSVDDRAQLWRDGLARPRRPRRVRLVAEHDAQTVGFVVGGPADGDDDRDAGEVYALNVDPDVWGRGAGQALLSAAVEALASDGFDELVLWVHPDNQRARGFYEHTGWDCEGTTRQQEVLGIEVPEIRYRRTV